MADSENSGKSPRVTLKGGHPHILVIDDSQPVRDLLIRTLSGPPLNANVEAAADGAEGLRMVSEGVFDCVVCDILMPKLDGMGFLKQVRSERNRLELPVIFLTVRETTKDKLAGFRAGASDFQVKPIEPDELTARVETQVQLARAHRGVKALSERLQILVETDPLTDVGNRRRFQHALDSELGRSRRFGTRLALCLIDVDRFKDINDAFGHQTGDQVLRRLAGALQEGARKYDTVTRIGGEEFAIVLPEVSAENALRVAERIRNQVETGLSNFIEGHGVTISLGLAFGPREDDDLDSIYRRADQALYEAKQAGRNRVEAESDA